MNYNQCALDVISQMFKLSEEDLKGYSRRADVVHPRFIAIKLMRELGKYSTTDIGEFWGRDHTTSCNALARADELLRDKYWRKVYSVAKFQVKERMLEGIG